MNKDNWAVLLLFAVNISIIMGYIIFIILGKSKKRSKDLINRVEGSKILSESAQNYWFTITEPIVRLLIFFRCTPNIITLFALFLGFLAGYFFYLGNWGLAGWLVIASGVFDIFDGRVARATNSVSKYGAYLDSVADRYSDGAILIGLALFFRNSFMLLPILISFIGFFAISYNKAKAETYGIKCNVGLFQRPERVFLLGVSSIFTPMLSLYINTTTPFLIFIAILILMFGTIFTSVYRIIHTVKQFKTKNNI